MTDERTRTQARAVLDVLRSVLGPDLVGVYLHGSAAHCRLRPSSDLDLLAVSRRSLGPLERRTLLQHLLDLSGRRARRVPGRPVELTVVVQPDVRPWRYPPPVDFQYGEWLRDDYLGGTTPEPGTDPDLALLVTVARRAEQALAGPPLSDVLDPVPAADVRRACVAGVPALLADLEDDTRNVLLTLARVWTTLETHDIRSKDEAADWALERLPGSHRPVMRSARADYLGDSGQARTAALADATACADYIAAEIASLDTCL